MRGNEVFFLPRHGATHSIAPHLINYRANVLAMRIAGVRRLYATSAVGSLNSDMPPGTCVLLSQFLDFTKSRPTTFADSPEAGVIHLDFTRPYCSELRDTLALAARHEGVSVATEGCYGCFEGPRYETAAEIRMCRILGADVVGMTGCPEVMLAREAGLCYSSVAVVTNRAAGLAEEPLSHEDVLAIMSENNSRLQRLLMRAIDLTPPERSCGCPTECMASMGGNCDAR